ncbi:hypothetical protein [Umezawaea sp.]|uniref:hypothetical protein n=1 Tax=Umezawaea sp. TaxID=1955258 RepID=UPI002ED66F24
MKRIAGVVLLLAGAVLTAAASSRPLYETKRFDSGYRSGARLTPWGGEYTTPGGAVEVDPFPILLGVPSVVAAVLLVLVAVLELVSARIPARAAPAVGVAAVVAAALLVGTVWSMWQMVLSAISREDPIGGSAVTVVGSGMVLLLIAALVAVAGALLVQRRPEPAVAYQVPFDDDTDTPPMGTPIHPSVSTEESSPG